MLNHLPPTILVLDPDVVLRTNISNSLERSGFNVLTASKWAEASGLFDRLPNYKKPTLVILRDELPDLSGIEVCTIIKTKEALKSTLVLMISENIKKILEVKNLENSFDDFIMKPFSQSSLVQKVKSILGRHKPSLASRILAYKDLKMDLASFKVSRNNREIHLGPTEFKILQCLIEKPNKIYSRDDIMRYVWGNNANVEMRTIDVHVNRLRSALKLPNEEVPFIKTVRSVGYCLDFDK